MRNDKKPRMTPRRDAVQAAAYGSAIEQPGSLEECKARYELNLREWDELEAFAQYLEGWDA